MTVYSWRRDPVPADLRVRQVYGWIFDARGCVVIWRENGHTGLPGGRPESYDADAVATLRREAREEVTVDVLDPRYLGYQRVDEHEGRPPFAQIRMIARLGDVYPAEPDPDTGTMKTRVAVPPHRAAAELAWGEHGREQAAAAAALAFRLWGLRAAADEPERSLTVVRGL